MIEKDSLFLEQLIAEAIDFIQKNEPPDGYLLGFSGGKDSQVIYELAKMSGVKFHAYFRLTSLDPPEVINFIKTYYPDVEIKLPNITFWQLMEKYKLPPTSKWRYCCRELKEIDNGKLLVGIRATESNTRAKRDRISKFKNKVHYKPIFYWTESDVWEFHRKYNLPHCCLYDEGYTRIGCIACCMKTPKQREKDFERYPNFYLAYMKTFERIAKEHPEKWTSAEQIMNWWLKKEPPKIKNQEANSC